MSKEEMEDDDVENVGIMQGFMQDTEEEEDADEEEYSSDEANSARILNRRPDSPEILMNNLRGDMRSIDARRDELADLVGYKAATETPEEVLAMLQPVLAQQAGIGALPQSQAMAQGPQPPMPLPPEGMGAPPMGAPPPPPGGAPSPSGDQVAALMASAGSPSGGSQAPMIGPDGQPIPPEGIPPIAMRDGGLVQRFSEGSDEEGVTPMNPMSAAQPLLYSPELVNQAQQSMMQLMTAQPQPVPSLKDATASRLAEYQSVLGDDRSGMKAGILFDIAQAGLNLASNRGPGGEVLRGSPVSRFAGAFSGVPGSIQKRVGAIEDAQRQLKLLALQAAEKDRSEIMDMNSKLERERRSLMSSIVTANARFRGSGGDTTSIRSMVPGGDWEMRYFLSPGLVERYARGETTPDEDNQVDSAVSSWTEPRIVDVLDPYGRPTGQTRQMPGKRLPPHVQRAIDIRRSGALPAGSQPRISTAEELPDYIPPMTARPETDPLPSGLRAAPSTAPDPLITEPPTTTPDGRPIREVPMSPQEVAAAPVNLWRDRAKIAGPIAAAYAAVSRIPGLGDPMRELTLRRKQAEFVTEDLIQTMLKSDNNAVTEQRILAALLSTDPAAFTDPEVYGTNLIALGSSLEEELNRHNQIVNRFAGKVNAATLNDSIVKIMIYEKTLKNLGLPKKVYSEQELVGLPEGTEVLWQGWVPATVERVRQ